jgi:hypothetical protein
MLGSPSEQDIVVANDVYLASLSLTLPPKISMLSDAVSIDLTKTLAELALYGVYLVLFAAVIYFFRCGFMVSKKRPLLLELGIVVQFLTITAVSTPLLVYCPGYHPSAYDHIRR